MGHLHRIGAAGVSLLDIEPTTDSSTYTGIKPATTNTALRLEGNGTSGIILYEAYAATQTPSGTTVTVDFVENRFHKVDFGSATGNVTFTLSNPVAGCTYIIQVIQGPVARNAIWPGTVLWAGGNPPTISTANDAIDFIQLHYDGTNFFGFFSQAFA